MSAGERPAGSNPRATFIVTASDDSGIMKSRSAHSSADSKPVIESVQSLLRRGTGFGPPARMKRRDLNPIEFQSRGSPDLVSAQDGEQAHDLSAGFSDLPPPFVPRMRSVSGHGSHAAETSGSLVVSPSPYRSSSALSDSTAKDLPSRLLPLGDDVPLPTRGRFRSASPIMSTVALKTSFLPVIRPTADTRGSSPSSDRAGAVSSLPSAPSPFSSSSAALRVRSPSPLVSPMRSPVRSGETLAAAESIYAPTLPIPRRSSSRSPAAVPLQQQQRESDRRLRADHFMSVSGMSSARLRVGTSPHRRRSSDRPGSTRSSPSTSASAPNSRPVSPAVAAELPRMGLPSLVRQPSPLDGGVRAAGMLLADTDAAAEEGSSGSSLRQLERNMTYIHQRLARLHDSGESSAGGARADKAEDQADYTFSADSYLRTPSASSTAATSPDMAEVARTVNEAVAMGRLQPIDRLPLAMAQQQLQQQQTPPQRRVQQQQQRYSNELGDEVLIGVQSQRSSLTISPPVATLILTPDTARQHRSTMSPPVDLLLPHQLSPLPRDSQPLLGAPEQPPPLAPPPQLPPLQPSPQTAAAGPLSRSSSPSGAQSVRRAVLTAQLLVLEGPVRATEGARKLKSELVVQQARQPLMLSETLAELERSMGGATPVRALPPPLPRVESEGSSGYDCCGSGSASVVAESTELRQRIESDVTATKAVSMAQAAWRCVLVRRWFVAAIQRYRHRTRVAFEIMQTEERYLSMLQAVVEEVKVPLETTQSIPDDDLFMLFGHLDSILQVSNELLAVLQKRLNRWSPLASIGDIFLDIAPRLRCYLPYCNKYTDALITLTHLRTVSPAFVALETNFRRKYTHTLDAVLIMPVQRLARYDLLLAQAHKRTGDANPDHMLLVQAAAAVRDVLSFVNEGVRERERAVRLSQLHASLGPAAAALHLDATERALVRDGELTETFNCTESHRVVLFLFTDLLLIACRSEPVRTHSTAMLNTSSTLAPTSTPAAAQVSRIPMHQVGMQLLRVLPLSHITVTDLTSARDLPSVLLMHSADEIQLTGPRSELRLWAQDLTRLTKAGKRNSVSRALSVSVAMLGAPQLPAI